MRVLQFVYALPPHVGGLEQIVEQFSEGFVSEDYGKILTITSSLGQQENDYSKLYFKKRVIGYIKNGVEIAVMPSFGLVNNYPVPKIWLSDFWYILKYAREYKPTIIQIHMRFFTYSILGWALAKLRKIPLVMMEHSSNFVQFTQFWKTSLGRFYDNLFGRFIYRTADAIIATSEVCKEFVARFTKKYIHVIYRGIDKKDISPCHTFELKEKFPGKILIGVIGRLVYWKNMHSLILAYYSLEKVLQEKIQLCIIGGGDEYERLLALDTEKKVYFTGEVNFQEAINYQSQLDIYMHPSSHGGALAGTLLQAMTLGNMIVATPHEGAAEVIRNGENGILLKNDSPQELARGIDEAVSLFDENNSLWKQKNQIIIHEQFVWRRQLQKIVHVYKSIQ